jgi:outer membrane protein OmpA-like peptidoglycan-associated protein
MKVILKIVLILLMVSSSISLYSQQKNPWTASLWMHSVNGNTSDYFSSSDWEHMFPKLAFTAPLRGNFSLMPSFAFGKISDVDFWDLDVSLKYDLTQTRLQPYIVAGGGINSFNSDTYGLGTVGLGLNFWVTEKIGLTAQTNYDYVPDFEDYFHNAVGIVVRFGGGPKDSDKDGIPDESDSCPKQAGPSSTNGCPDGDADGVKDSDDQCPTEMGTAATFGCPDSDGDGIANAKDECPTVAGIAQFNGCPDSDGDGITDKNDACPTQKGTAQFNGCPDSDGDGITDKEDACPQVAGLAAMKGCPDKDGDGVTDSADNCPDQPGTAARNGCPEIKAEEVKAIEAKLNIAAKRIQFETGSATIKQASYPEIDQIVAIMNQYTFTKFDIEGYTDNTGKLETNRTLSQQRADAVKNYIAGKGIAGDRLNATGFGPDKPIATNNTAAGRAQNRRVEIHLKQ